MLESTEINEQIDKAASNHHIRLVARKICSVEELETQPMGTTPRMSNRWLPGGERHRKRNLRHNPWAQRPGCHTAGCLEERGIEKGKTKTELLQDNDGETSQRWDGAHIWAFLSTQIS